MLLAAALKVYDSNREWNLIAPLFVSLLKSHFRDRLNRITFLPRFFKLPFNYHSGKLWISYRLLAAGLKPDQHLPLIKCLLVVYILFSWYCRWISSYSDNKINSSRHLVVLPRFNMISFLRPPWGNLQGKVLFNLG